MYDCDMTVNRLLLIYLCSWLLADRWHCDATGLSQTRHLRSLLSRSPVCVWHRLRSTQASSRRRPNDAGADQLL